MKARDIKDLIQNQLNLIDLDEQGPIAQLLLEEICNREDLLINKEIKISADRISELVACAKRINGGEPVQHVLGFAWFADNQFKVTPDVLIPRQETEELVALVSAKIKPGMTVLDIGTGSGIIPITLSLSHPTVHFTGWDISKKALEVATVNSENLGGKVHFESVDILDNPPLSKFDIIISNPPYVMESENKTMSKTVLDYDPKLALFVPDEDPLLFYRAISNYAQKNLNPEGRLFFEINEKFGPQIKELLMESGFREVRVIKDLNGKDRMVSGIINSKS